MRKLTLYQVNEILNHERDEQGQLVPQYEDDSQPYMSPDQIFAAVWKSRGLGRREIEVKLAEHHEIERLRQKLAEQNLAGDALDEQINALRREQLKRRPARGRLNV